MSAIGIDLGTSCSSVAVFQQGQVEIIANDQGNRVTPSYVAYSNTGELIDDAMRNPVTMNPSNTIFDIKRLMGRKFDDPMIQDYMKRWPLKVVSKNGDPEIQMRFHGETKNFAPKKISSMILMRMKKIAESYLGEKVENAVITVPVFFNNSQRVATKKAAEMAGLNVLRIMNEPTAAALAYGLNILTPKTIINEANLLIFDFGSAKLDVSILTTSDGPIFEVLATASDPHLGGGDLDSRLVDHLCQEFWEKYKKDVKSNIRSLQRLRIAAEKAKWTLSLRNEAIIKIDALYECIDYKTKISRTQFEQLCDDLFAATLVPVDKALKDAELKRSLIYEVVLIGGSSRIPKIQSLLQNFFDGKRMNLSVNPDFAVAYGAAIQAAIMSGNESIRLKDVLVVEAAPHSLGIEIAGSIMTPIVKRNAQVPWRGTKTFTTATDNQTGVTIRIFEGEFGLTRNNTFVREFELNGIVPAPCGIPKIEVTFDLDCDGFFEVTARENVSNGHRNVIRIDKDRVSSSRALRIFERRMSEVGCRNQVESFPVKRKLSSGNLLG